jgi:hypothetical protein
MKDLYNETLVVPASAYDATVAAGSGDNVAVVGLTIDRMNLVPNGARGAFTNIVPRGVMFCLSYECVLGAGNTVSVGAAKVETSADGTTWSTLYDQTGASAPTGPTWPAAGVVDTGATGGSTQRGVVVFGCSLGAALRYVRFDFTPDLSASGTDTGKFVASAVFSGIDEVPPGVV